MKERQKIIVAEVLNNGPSVATGLARQWGGALGGAAAAAGAALLALAAVALLRARNKGKRRDAAAQPLVG